jgi:glycosyltransferase involved in cell wall biosynthesis
MRALFYASEECWSGCARASISAAHGLAQRGHHVTVACCPHTPVHVRAERLGLDVVPIAPGGTTLGTCWTLRHVLRDRFIEVVFVATERDQLIVSSAMRLAERGAVIRRIPSFEAIGLQRSGRLALKIASGGLLFSTDREAKDVKAPGWALPPAFAPLGVDAASYEEVQPVPRAELDVPQDDGLLIVCSYDPSGRLRIATLFRALALLAPHHRQLHVVVVGTGSEKDDLRLHASALGVVPVLTFLGERDDERAVLRAADVGWVASGDDTGAYACLDFMSLAIPVIVDRSRLGSHFVADRISGLLLSPGDAAQTASAISAFLGDRERRVAMGNAARTRVQREFPESAMIDGFERAGETGCDRSKWIAR